MSSGVLFIGIDVGTTRVKAIAVDPDGRERGAGERATGWHRAGASAEIDPAALVELALTAAADAVDAAPGDQRRVLGVGVTGMAETGVLVDGQDRPLAPAIAWHDPRGDVDTIARELGPEAFQVTTGLPLTALPSLAKLLWLRRNRPETAGAARFYSVGEWVVRRLGGDAVAELSLASRTGLLELGTARPWQAAAELLDWPPLLADAVVAGTAIGRVTRDGVPPALRGAVLTVAGHDHQVAAYGVGAASAGALFDSLGTAEALVRTIHPPLPPQQVAALTARGMSVGWGVLADHLCVLAGLPTGLTLGRIAGMLGATTAAERAVLGEQALAEPTEHPTLRLLESGDEGVGIAGITDGVTPALIWRATIAGLVVRSQHALAGIDAVAGAYREVVVAGGWLNDPALLAAKRRQFPAMRTTAIAEPGAYGAALLAARAAGVPVPAAPPPLTLPEQVRPARGTEGVQHVLQLEPDR
jgi:sugar (pentulose or hexulose) kinase